MAADGASAAEGLADLDFDVFLIFSKPIGKQATGCYAETKANDFDFSVKFRLVCFSLFVTMYVS